MGFNQLAAVPGLSRAGRGGEGVAPERAIELLEVTKEDGR